MRRLEVGAYCMQLKVLGVGLPPGPCHCAHPCCCQWFEPPVEKAVGCSLSSIEKCLWLTVCAPACSKLTCRNFSCRDGPLTDANQRQSNASRLSMPTSVEMVPDMAHRYVGRHSLLNAALCGANQSSLDSDV